MDRNNLRKIIIGIIIFFLIGLFTVILTNILKNRNKTDNNDENLINSNNILVNNTITNEIQSDNDYILHKTKDTYIYFLLKYCLKCFYTQENNSNKKLVYIDKEVIEKLKLNENDFINRVNYGFCIDEIYEQKINENENIYAVYYRLGTASSECKERVVWIKIDDINKAFSIYPFEYLETNKYTNLKEKDKIKTDLSENIERKIENIYNEDEIKTNDKACILELFSRYKFDLMLDREHLYKTLEKKYREEKFKSFENYNQYIEENITSLYLEKIKEYGAGDYEQFKEYSGKGSKRKCVYF